jgi:hypothetical protein
MIINIHFFTIFVTIIFYFWLKSFKYNNLSLNNLDKKSKNKQSNLIYLLFAPISIYLTYYIFINKKSNVSLNQVPLNQIQEPIVYNSNILSSKNSSSSQMSMIFPNESTLSSN